MVVIVAVVIVMPRALVVTLLLFLEPRLLLRRRRRTLDDQVGQKEIRPTRDDAPHRFPGFRMLREGIGLDRLPDLVTLRRLSLRRQGLVDVGGHRRSESWIRRSLGGMPSHPPALHPADSAAPRNKAGASPSISARSRGPLRWH